VIAGATAPLYAQGTEAAASATEIAKWSIITAGFALAFAAGLGALAQGRAVGSATEAIARNPGAVGDIRGSLILGLVLMVARHLRPAHLFDPVLPQAVQRLGGTGSSKVGFLVQQGGREDQRCLSSSRPHLLPVSSLPFPAVFPR
jgi:F0F1-type ATP synthase membrane subunit c/vacuolar-type H+-ATPase subunit K